MKCAFCGSHIYTPFTGKKNDGTIVNFCDILCGRLFDINESPIEPFMKEYNRAYTANRLTAAARMAFERFNDYVVFKMIPVCSFKETPDATKNYYNKLFGI